MSAAGHTPGPWARGVTLMTAQTRRWAPEQIAANDLIERRIVFASFSHLDEGRARRRIATCEREEDARLIAAAPCLLKALQPFVEHNSSDEYITIRVRTADVAKARAAIARATTQQPDSTR